MRDAGCLKQSESRCEEEKMEGKFRIPKYQHATSHIMRGQADALGQIAEVVASLGLPSQHPEAFDLPLLMLSCQMIQLIGQCENVSEASPQAIGLGKRRSPMGNCDSLASALT